MNKSKTKRPSLPRLQTDSEREMCALDTSFKADFGGDVSLPPMIRSKLQDLFSQIEKEFEILYNENLHLQDKVDALNEKLERDNVYPLQNEKHLFGSAGSATIYESIESEPHSASKSKKLGGSSQKLKTAHKLKAQTSKIVSSFKTPSLCASVVKELRGHRDGIWDVDVARVGVPLVGTASADHTACIWQMDTGKCMLRYNGHAGSVNSIKFHPSRDLVLTASGDNTVHVWQAAFNLDIKTGSSDEEVDLGGADSETTTSQQMFCGGGDPSDFENAVSSTLRTPIAELLGHSSVVSHAEWMPSGDQVVTASWDRSAALYDVETREQVGSLTGHEQELTHTSAHHSQRLVVTSSKDTTFRLWDFREPIHSVSVFQGHTDSVTSAVFARREDKIVSGSDDRSVKVWDLRNMRSPLATIRSDSAVNKLAVSSSGLIAVPHDNRQVRLYDFSGQRIARQRQGHQRMVCSVAWADDHNLSSSFFSCGFDRLTLGWSIQNMKDL